MKEDNRNSIFEQINNLKKPVTESQEKSKDIAKDNLQELLSGVAEEIQRVLDENDFTQEDLCRITRCACSD